LLLVAALEPTGSGRADLPFIQVETKEGPADKKGKTQLYDRLMLSTQAVKSEFKVLLIPFHMGDALPKIVFDAPHGVATVLWANQKDRFSFKTKEDGRTQCAVHRGNTLLFESK